MKRSFELASLRVLVVDDDPSVRESLVRFLEDHEFKVSSADSAEAALKLALKIQFDFAIVDIRLPNMEGGELIPRLHAYNPRTKFMVYTGSADYVLSDELVSFGMRPEHLFYKPVSDMKTFVETIKRLWEMNP
jgi:CheY-like chemotaxis protein